MPPIFGKIEVDANVWQFCGIALIIVLRVVLASYYNPHYSTFFQDCLVSCLFCEYSLGRCINETWLPSLREEKRAVLDFHGDFLPLGGSGESLNMQVESPSRILLHKPLDLNPGPKIHIEHGNMVLRLPKQQRTCEGFMETTTQKIIRVDGQTMAQSYLGRAAASW